jgi:hypothetical protein|tara:strand:+ start:603 stop:3674 length:3072 start_codon:yes stop_codon:yes gene_type:complete
MAEISGADLPFFTYFEDEEIRIILNELFTFYDGEATTEEKRLIEKWMPFIAKDRNSAMEFSLVVGKQNSRIDRTVLAEVPEDYLEDYVTNRDARLEALNDPLLSYEFKEIARNALIDIDKSVGFDVLNLGTEPFTKDEIRAKIDEQQNAWFSQDISQFDIIKSYEETDVQFQTIDRANNRDTNPVERMTFVIDNSFEPMPIESEREFEDEKRWEYLGPKNDSAMIRPSLLNEDDFLFFFLDKAVEMGKIDSQVRKYILNPDQEITESAAISILAVLGIKPTAESYFTVGASFNPIAQVDSLMAEYVTDQKAKIQGQHTSLLKAEDPDEFVANLLEKDADDYVAIVGEQAINRQAQQDLFDNYSWDPTKDIDANIKEMFTVEQTDGEGLLYSLNPNNKSWPKELLDAYDIKNIQNVAGEIQRQIISNIKRTDAGKAYLAKLASGEPITVQESFNVFNEVIEIIGVEGEKFLALTANQLNLRLALQFGKDKLDPKKMEMYTDQLIGGLANGGVVDPSLIEYIDRDAIKLALTKYETFEDAFGDLEFHNDFVARAEENKRLGDFNEDMGSISGREAATEKFLDSLPLEQKEAFDNAPEEFKNAVYNAIGGFTKASDAFASEPFMDIVNNAIAAGDVVISENQASAFQSSIPDYVRGSYRSRGYINADTSEEFYNHIENEVIPNIAFRAQMVGVNTPDSLEKLIDSMLSGKDEEGNAVDYALPAYDYNQSDYDRQLGVTAADVMSGAAMPPSPFGRRGFEDITAKYDLSNLLPEIEPYAKTNPEFAAFMAQEMQKEGFMKEWQKATTAQPLEDRGAFLEEREDQRAYWGGRLSDAQSAYDANPSQENADALQKAQSDDAKAQQHYEIETGKTKFAVFPPEEGADDPSQYTLPDQLKDRQLITDPSLPEEIRYASYFKALEDISPEDPMTETERQKILADFMTPTADEVFDAPGGASELAQLMTTTPQTTPEFFQSQLPGFEKRYKESSFFKQEEERIKREQETAESQRRRQLRQRPTGMSVFTRARR